MTKKAVEAIKLYLETHSKSIGKNSRPYHHAEGIIGALSLVGLEITEETSPFEKRMNAFMKKWNKEYERRVLEARKKLEAQR